MNEKCNPRPYHIDTDLMINNSDYEHDIQLLRKVSSRNYNGYWRYQQLVSIKRALIFMTVHHQKTIDCNSEIDFREIIIR